MSATRISPPSEAALIERITRLEERKAAVAAEQADAILEFARAHAASQTADGSVDAEALERSIAAQVGLACRVSPSDGRRRVRIARDLHTGHVRVRELFSTGQLSEYKTAIVVTATSHLSADERAEVDRRLAELRIETLGVRRIHDLTRTLAAEVAPEKFATRCRAARTGRRVTICPAADGMADLRAHLPVEQAAACYAALVAAVNQVATQPKPVTRGRGQIMADTLVERLTGQTLAADVPMQIQIVVPVEALVDPGSPLPAQIPGHGPVPVDLLATSTARKTWRRLVTRDGIIIGGDSRRRRFTGQLAALIRARDGHRCREPYCDAPIRHIDHIRRWAERGRTEYENGRGLCEFHNHVRETPGWKARTTTEGIETTTPTGQTYTSDVENVAGARQEQAGAARNRSHSGPDSIRGSRSPRFHVLPGYCGTVVNSPGLRSRCGLPKRSGR